MGAGSLISLLVVAIIALAPLTAATFVGRRMGYRGIGLIAPWIAAVGLGLLIGFGFASLSYQVEPVGGGGPGRMSRAVSTWILALLLSGYFTTVVYLIVLAARRPPIRPADTAAVF